MFERVTYQVGDDRGLVERFAVVQEPNDGSVGTLVAPDLDAVPLSTLVGQPLKLCDEGAVFFDGYVIQAEQQYALDAAGMNPRSAPLLHFGSPLRSVLGVRSRNRTWFAPLSKIANELLPDCSVTVKTDATTRFFQHNQVDAAAIRSVASINNAVVYEAEDGFIFDDTPYAAEGRALPNGVVRSVRIVVQLCPTRVDVVDHPGRQSPTESYTFCAGESSNGLCLHLPGATSATLGRSDAQAHSALRGLARPGKAPLNAFVRSTDQQGNRIANAMLVRCGPDVVVHLVLAADAKVRVGDVITAPELSHEPLIPSGRVLINRVELNISRDSKRLVVEGTPATSGYLPLARLPDDSWQLGLGVVEGRAIGPR